jgi:hypothetical protein
MLRDGVPPHIGQSPPADASDVGVASRFDASVADSFDAAVADLVEFGAFSEVSLASAPIAGCSLGAGWLELDLVVPTAPAGSDGLSDFALGDSQPANPTSGKANAATRANNLNEFISSFLAKKIETG